MALEARGFTRPGRRTLLWSPPDSGAQALARWALAGRRWSLLVVARIAGWLVVTHRSRRRRLPLRRVRRRPSLLDIDLELRRRRGARPGRRVGGGQDDALPGRQRPRAADGRRADPRPHHPGRRGRRRLADASAQPAHRHRLPEPGDAAVAGGRHRLRGGRLRTDEPGRCRATRSSSAPGRRSTRLRIDGAGRARPPPPLRRPAAARRHRRAARHAARAPRARRADRAARPRRHAAGRRRDRTPGRRRRLDPGRRAEDRPAGRGLPATSIVLDEGRIALDGPAARCSPIRGSPSSGSPQPSSVRLRRAAEAAGVASARAGGALSDG